MELTAIRSTAPEPSEHTPYYDRYISLVGTADIVTTLEHQWRETVDLLSGLTDVKANYRYSPEKWSVKEMLGHVSDTERIMSYRALRIARNDRTPMEGFEQDDYVRGANFGEYRLPEMLEEFTCVRHATVLLFRHLHGEAWSRRGVANQNPVSVRALAYIIAGHEIYHRNMLKERYLKS
ncbi:MAG: DinB family protein [Bryobacteraceae bacterium]